MTKANWPESASSYRRWIGRAMLAMYLSSSVAFALIAFVSPVLACHPPYIEYEPIYESGRTNLSAGEIHRMADWRSKTRLAFPNSGQYYISVQENPRVGVSVHLAKIRLRNLKTLLLNFGVEDSDIFDTEIKNYGYGAPPNAEARRLASTAYISINPRCPHPCCPGPQPIDAKQADRGNHDQPK
ncbi:hypothetical protein AB4156_25805 [Cupriavidus sp. 2MCAB6]|uniref:hypothetical protein n=1 Tax=Cupriavidus sp. 2MCAB6 TaxID=3232981 RepID=UPI003F93DAA3